MAHLDDTVTLTDYWTVIRRRRRLIVACVATGAFLAASWTLLSPAAYTAHASVVIRQIQSDPFATSRIEDVGASTEQNVMASTVVASRVAKRLRETDPLELVHHLSVDNPPGTLVLDLTFTADSASAARAGAQAFATSYLAYRAETADLVKTRKRAQIDTQLAAIKSELDGVISTINGNPANSAARSSAEARRGELGSRISDLETARSEVDVLDTTPGEVIRPAEAPSAPDGPGTMLTLVGGSALGLLGGIALALFRDRTDPHVLDHRDLVDLLDDEPIGEIPGARRTTAPSTSPSIAPGVVAVYDPTSVAAGEYRRLRARVWPERTTGPRRVLVVTPTSGPDADEVAANLAVIVAATGWSVVLAWLERAEPATCFSFSPATAAVAPPGSPLVQRLIEPAELPNLALLPGLGLGDGANPVEVAEDCLAEIDAFVDVQIVAGEPILSSPQAVELAPLVDGVIVAFNQRTTARADLARALETLGTSAKVIGVVAIGVPSRW